MGEFRLVFVRLTIAVSIVGSYDHTLKLFDARVDKSVMTMDHGQPVESLLLYPSEGLLVSAGSHRNNHLRANDCSDTPMLHCTDICQGFKKTLCITCCRWALCESVGSAERRAASRVTEEPPQNCHVCVSQQQRTEAAVSISGQVR